MKLSIKWIKSLILIVLIITSIYQASRLWFDDISDRNFFYSFFQESVPTYDTRPYRKGMFIMPEAIYVHFNDNENEFTSIKPTHPQFSKIMTSSMTLFKALQNKGVSIQEPPNLKELLNNKSVIFNYSFNIDTHLFMDDLGIKMEDLKQNMEQFNQVILTPADNEKHIHIYFYYQYDNHLEGYKVDKSLLLSANESLNTSIYQLQQSHLPVYISTLKDGFKLFNYNTLIPLPSQTLTYFEKLYFKTPFMDGDSLNTVSFNTFINQFFENPELKVETKSDDENVTLYGDGSIILKYNYDGILEYHNRKVEEEQKQSVLEAFYIADKFLENDSSLIEQEYYLDHIQVSDHEATFYYSYRFNGVKMLLSSHIKENYDLVYPMVVKVTNNKVIYYKRLLLEKEEIIEQMTGFDSNYVQALDDFYKHRDAEQIMIESMYLSYYMERLNMADFTWAIETENMTNVISLDR